MTITKFEVEMKIKEGGFYDVSIMVQCHTTYLGFFSEFKHQTIRQVIRLLPFFFAMKLRFITYLHNNHSD